MVLKIRLTKVKMSDIIFIEKLSSQAIIGIHTHEKLKKQPVLIDLKIKCKTKNAAKSDNIDDTVDYQVLCEDLKNYIQKSSFNLIETLAEKLTQRILKNSKVKSVKLTLRKPEALDICDSVGLTIKRKR